MSSEYLCLNAGGVLPTLLIDGVALTQSCAILEYLNERSSNYSNSLLPTTAIDRAKVYPQYIVQLLRRIGESVSTNDCK